MSKELFEKAASADIVQVLAGELTIKKKGPHYVALCPFHDDKQESLQVGGKGKYANKYHCFACGAHGSAVDFFVKSRGVSKIEAAEIVCRLAGEYVEKPFENAVERRQTAQNAAMQVLPPAGSAVTTFKKKFGDQIIEASRFWEYRTALDQLWGYVVRFDFGDGKKQTLPYTYRSDNRWHWLGFDDPRPAYKLPQLLKSESKTLLIVEGEKTCDAAKQAVEGSGWDTCTWIGGVNGVEKTDWSFAGKYETVYLYPDNDAAGMSAMLHIAHLLKERGLQTDCYIVPLDHSKEKGWDVADQDWLPGQLVAEVEEQAKSSSKISRLIKEVGKEISYICGPEDGRWTMRKHEPNTPANEPAPAPKSAQKQSAYTYDFEKYRDLLEKGEPGWSEFLAEQLRPMFRFDVNAGQWRMYEAGVWGLDVEMRHEKSAVKILQIASYDFIKYCFAKENEAEAANEDGSGWARKVKDLMKFRDAKIRQNAGIKSIVQGAAKYCTVKASDLDNHPLKFNCANGTLDLSTGEFHGHRATDLLTKKSAVAYKKGAKAEKWDAFVDKIFCGDKDLIRFMQKFAGYSLTALNDVQGVFFAFGHGANGKSVFFNVLRKVMGDYCVSVPNETFLAKRDAGQTDHNTASLEGARLAFATELPARRTFDMSKLKDLTGGEPVTIRRLYQQPYQIQVHAKILFSGNHKPNIGDDSEGARRRLYILPFNYRFPEAERREMSLVMAEFEREIDGILSWAVEGFKMYKAEGLERPDAIKRANQEYLEEQDNFWPFFETSYQPAKGAYVRLKDIFEDYCEWIGEDQRSVRSVRELSAYLKARGFTIDRRGSSGYHCVVNMSAMIKVEGEQVQMRDDFVQPTEQQPF